MVLSANLQFVEVIIFQHFKKKKGFMCLPLSTFILNFNTL